MSDKIVHTTMGSDLFVQAFDAGGVHLIDLPVDYSENQNVLIDALAEKRSLI